MHGSVAISNLLEALEPQKDARPDSAGMTPHRAKKRPEPVIQTPVFFMRRTGVA